MLDASNLFNDNVIPKKEEKNEEKNYDILEKRKQLLEKRKEILWERERKIRNNLKIERESPPSDR
jgi:hypothetical protein